MVIINIALTTYQLSSLTSLNKFLFALSLKSKTTNTIIYSVTSRNRIVHAKRSVSFPTNNKVETNKTSCKSKLQDTCRDTSH